MSSTQQKNTYKLIWQAENSLLSLESLTIFYYDSYHSEISYWNAVRIEINVFLSEPPIFLSTLDNLTVQAWSKFIYKLPNAYDPEDNAFSVSLIGDSFDWIQLSFSNNSIYEIEIDASLLGVLEKDTEYPIGLEIKDITGAFNTYYLYVIVFKFSTPYFDYIPNLNISNSKNENINYKINSNFDLKFNSLEIQAEEWNSDNAISWISNYLNLNKTTMIVNLKNIETGTYCVKVVARFTWNNLFR